jgi:hypothetical protein
VRPILIVLVLLALPAVLSQIAGSPEDAERQRELANTVVDYRNAKAQEARSERLTPEIASRITALSESTADRLDSLATGETATDVVAIVFAEHLRASSAVEAEYYDLNLEYDSLLADAEFQKTTEFALEREIELLEMMIDRRESMVDIAEALPNQVEAALLRNGFSASDARSQSDQIAEAYRRSVDAQLAALDIAWLHEAKQVADLLLRYFDDWSVVDGSPAFESPMVATQYNAMLDRLSELERQHDQMLRNN